MAISYHFSGDGLLFERQQDSILAADVTILLVMAYYLLDLGGVLLVKENLSGSLHI